MMPPRSHTLRRATVLLAATAAVAACTRYGGESPFALWGLRPGADLATLHQVIIASEHRSWTCENRPGGFRRCSIYLNGPSGELTALGDSAGRAVLLSFAPVRYGGGFAASDVMLENDVSIMRRQWGRVKGVRPDRALMRDGANEEMFGSPDGRWEARMVTRGHRLPELIEIYDRRAIAAARGAQERFAADSAAREASRREAVAVVPAADSVSPAVAAHAPALRKALRDLIRAEERYYYRRDTYTADRTALAVSPEAAVTIEVLAADEMGWAARARHARLPGRSCVLWLGQVAAPPATDGERRVGKSGETVCDAR
ncbi:MAG TPA: hypothetical protein VNA89_08230 [Gemmatimonadaceae bacterium]|nr:hypothetical protein [Gemmatimonadaceae bacterium]